MTLLKIAFIFWTTDLGHVGVLFVALLSQVPFIICGKETNHDPS